VDVLLGPGNPAPSRARAAALLVSLAALGILAHRVDPRSLAAIFHQVRPAWLGAAVAAFAASLGLGAWRWHQMLRITGTAVTGPVTCRLTLVGHAFSSLLFGAAVGDVAKAALYSRAYGFPVERILAASALDRSAGAISTLLYAAATVACAVWSAPRLHWDHIQPSSARWTLAVCAVAAVVAGAVLRMTRRRWMPLAVRLGREVGNAVRQLRLRPGLTLVAVVAGVGMQLLVSTVLACCLQSIHPGGLPWSRLLWTFPVIGLAAAFPVTVAGAGAREGAAIFIWAGFGIQGPVSFAACALTLAVTLVWALPGIALAWRGFQRPLPMA
jgi:uncharacterized membrane protein YbhN (UPF0104 family)